MSRQVGQRLLLLALAGAVVVFFALDGARWFSLSQIQSVQGELALLYAARPLAVMAGYAAIYVLLFALALPVNTVLALAGGALFGFWLGTLLASFASSVGALLAFLTSRYLFADAARHHFGARLAEVDKGIAREGGFYLFTLRLMLLLPPATINVLFGLTRMRAATFYWVSQLGMLGATMVYVNAGTQLARLESVRDILSPTLLASLLLLGLFPLLAKRIAAAVRAQRV